MQRDVGTRGDGLEDLGDLGVGQAPHPTVANPHHHVTRPQSAWNL